MTDGPSKYDSDSQGHPSGGAPGRGERPEVPGSTGGVPSGPAPDPVPEPMTFSLLGRFFAVPLVVIMLMVGGAVLVVLLFGGPASPDDRSIDELMQALETGSGEKSLGILLPREKELWQAALELSMRLEEKEKEKELTPEQLDEVARRLSSMVRADVKHIETLATIDEGDRKAQREVRSKRLEFLIRALGRTEQPAALNTLIAVVEEGNEPHARVAMEMLAELRQMERARDAISPILRRLRTARLSETKLMACTVLSVLGEPEDEHVIGGLNAVRLASEGEVAWSAALALARLHSDLGKTTLFDLLDRSFLEEGQLYRVIDVQGVEHRYRLPPERVNAILLAAIDAAAHLEDPDLWEMIEDLQEDGSPLVEAGAKKAVRNRADNQAANPQEK